MYHLKDSLETEMIQDFECLKKHFEKADFDLAMSSFSSILEKKLLCKALLGPNNTTDVLVGKIFEMFRKIAFENYRQSGVEEHNYEIVYIFLTSGTFGIIKEWIRKGCIDKPEEIIRLLHIMYTSCIKGFS